MPKKSFTFNGFGGGVNKDADLADLQAQNKGKDEVATCKNLFLDERGKIIAKYPTIVDGDPSGGVDTNNNTVSNITEPRKLIIADNKAYMNLGVYSSQNEVNWSGNDEFFARRPRTGGLNDSNPDAHTTGVDLDVEVDNTGDLILFQGATAVYNNTGSGIIFGKTSTDGLATPGKWLRFIKDKDADGQIGWQADYWTDGGTGDDEGTYQINDAVSDTGVDVTFGDDADGTDHVDMDATTGTLNATKHANMWKIMFWHDFDGDTNANSGQALMFRGGRTLYDGDASSDQQDGFYGKYFPQLKNRDIRLEIKTALNAAQDGLIIYYDCGGTGDFKFDYHHGDEHDDNGRCWKLSRGDLIGKGTEDDYQIINIKYSSAFWTGSNFDPGQVKYIAIGPFQEEDNSDWTSTTSSVRLKEFSLTEDVESTWDNKNYAFYQTGINKKGVESLPTLFGENGGDSSIEGTNYPMLFRVFKPGARWGDSDNSWGYSGGGGRLYYQKLDNVNNPTGEKFLLGEWNYDLGVKMAGQRDFTEWNDSYHDGTETQPAYEMIMPDPPIASTYSVESGYPDGVKTIHALFKTSAVIGRTVYIGNVSKEKADVMFKIEDHGATFTPRYSAIVTNNTTTNDTFTIAPHSHPNGHVYCDFEDTHGFEVNDYIVTSGFANAANNGLFKATAFSSSGTDEASGAGNSLSDNVMAVTATDGSDAGLVTANETASGLISFRAFESSFNQSLILKGVPGNVAGFPDNQYIDLDLGSESIQAMEGIGDRLFVFSETLLTIINVAQDIEFLETTMPGYGVRLPRQITRVGEGLVVINSTGVHYFDGDKFTDLTLGKLDSVDIQADNCAVMYDANRKMLWCWFDDATSDSDGDADPNGMFFYSFRTGTWVGEMRGITDGIGADIGSPGSNSFIGEDGKAWFEDSDNLYYIGTSTSADTANRTIQLETGKISCGNIARNKRFYKVHLTVTNPTTDQKVYWKTDVSGSYDAGTALAATDGMQTITLTGAKGKWIQLKVASTSNNAKSSFEIGDISLIYREKTVK